VTFAFAHDGAFWRRLAHLGASRGPEWWVRFSPPVFGIAAAIAVPSARRAVRANLRRLRGEGGPLRDALDVGRTFATYASCHAEVLSHGSKNAREPTATVLGRANVDAALGDDARASGAVIVTAHTAGWETVGPLLRRDKRRDVIMVMAREGDARAMELHDAARAAAGLKVVHVGDPLSSLVLLRELRRGAVVAIQIDRVPRELRTRAVSFLGGPGAIPEGPLRLAAAAGAPILPLFCARVGYRDYLIDARPPIVLPPRPTEADLDLAAQSLASELAGFLRAHPTQWFHFGEPSALRGASETPAETRPQRQ
jgi:KDO2-lipid IV(A) lauroyltransferase